MQAGKIIKIYVQVDKHSPNLIQDIFHHVFTLQNTF